MKLNIKLKLLGAGLIAILIILIPIETYQFIKDSAQLKKQLTINAENTSARLSKSLASPLWDLDDTQVYETIDSEMAQKDIYGILITAQDKKTINYGKKKNEKWKPVIHVKPIKENALLSVDAEIKKDETSLGFVQVYVTGKFLKEEFNQKIIQKTISLFILCIILSVVLIIISNILIFSPLSFFRKSIDDIADGEGDLTKRLPEKNDEIGELSKSFNRFISLQQKLIKEIAVHSNEVLGASENLDDVSEKMKQGVITITDKSSSIAMGSDEVNTNISNILNFIQETNQNINMVATAAEELASTIKEISANGTKANEISQKAVKLTEISSTKVETLGSDIESIGKVTDTITDISDQTNLLALNATIEAARAGEAGKGFAVVANEIKELANQTAEATKTIKNSIEKIQVSSIEAVAGIEEVTSVISETNSLVANIAASVEEQSSTTVEIANNVTQASSGINEVTQSINDVSNVSSKISDETSSTKDEIENITINSQAVSSSSGNLSRLSEKLRKIILKFKV